MTEPAQTKRSLLKSKWSKIRKADDDADGKTFTITDDVSDFLKGARSPAPSNTQPSGAPKLSLTLDHQWAGADQLRQFATQDISLDSTATATTSYPTKPKRRRGLTVQFVVTDPEVIGRGGDDSQTPTISISEARTQLLRLQSEPILQRGLSPNATPRGASPASGSRDRAYTSPTSIQAHANLISAGVFGDRPPSRDDRRMPQPQHSPQSSYSSAEALTPPTSEEEALHPGIALHSAPLTRKPLPTQPPEVPAHRYIYSQRPGSSSPEQTSARPPRRMLHDEGAAFSRVHRVSKALAIAPEDVRPSSSSSSASCYSSDRASINTPVMHEPPRSPANALPLRRKPAPVTSQSSQTADQQYLMPGRISPQRITPPNTPPVYAGRLSDAKSPISPSAPMVPERNPLRSSPAPPDASATAAYNDFSDRVMQMKGVFRLTAQREKSGYITYGTWLRAAFWWLRKAKIDLEAVSKTRQRGLLMQPHVDMAKAWWILQDQLEFTSGAEQTANQEDEASLRTHLETLALWIQKNDLMPPQASLIQGQDTTIWVPPPLLTQSVASALISAEALTALREILPLSDTASHFLYNTMYAKVFIVDPQAQGPIRGTPCSLSIVRHRSQYRASLVLTTQDQTINILVAPKSVITWYDIAWQPKNSTMTIKLTHKSSLNVVMTESDYGSLANILEFTRTVDRSFQPAKGETLIFSSPLRTTQYSSKDPQQTFPNGMIRNAFVGVFEVVNQEINANLKRSVHRGYRVKLITPTTSRTLGVVTHDFNAKQPFFFEIPERPSKSADPSVILRAAVDDKLEWRMLLVFESKSTANGFMEIVDGKFRTAEEYTKLKLPLSAFSVQSPDGKLKDSQSHSLGQLRWRDLAIVDKRSAQPHTPLSESLRLVLTHTSGTFVDRLNLQSGALLLNLPISHDPSVTMLRTPQLDTVSSLDWKPIAPAALPPLIAGMTAISSVATMRTYGFTSLSDLHTFQEALTGHSVVCDLMPSRFSIARQMAVVSIHKKVDTTNVRLQVLKREDGETQIAVFLGDFALAEAMIFAVKATDTFERMKGPGVKLVEAKFSLKDRREDDDENEVDNNGICPAVRKRFVNLEGLQYKEEADDITIMFADDRDADAFCAALPGKVQEPKGFLKRR